MSEVLPSIQSLPLSERAYGVIRQAIFSQRFNPGDPLRELHLARELGVSQAIVREALAQLEHVGLVTRVRNKGTRVTRLSEQEARERFAVRLHLEEMAWVEAAARMEAEDFDTLHDRLGTLARAAEQEDYFLSVQADLGFHRCIWELSGNRILSQQLQQVTEPLMAFVSAEWWRRAGGVQPGFVQLHEDVIAALRTGHPEEIRTAVRVHNSGMQDMLDWLLDHS